MEYPKELVVKFLLSNTAYYKDCFDKDFNVIDQAYEFGEGKYNYAFDDGQNIVIDEDDFEWLENHEEDIVACQENIDGFAKKIFIDNSLDFPALNVIYTDNDGKRNAYYSNEDGCTWLVDQAGEVNGFIADWMGDFLEDMADITDNIKTIDYMDDTLKKCVIDVLNEKLENNESDIDDFNHLLVLKKLFKVKLDNQNTKGLKVLEGKKGEVKENQSDKDVLKFAEER